ncbi:uncharacterized protein [Cicer arietinum]|uniref:uncharacterized protein n=1 Tax=Cicer arietinum TaxID=3827 RepID=UPI003CC656F9
MTPFKALYGRDPPLLIKSSTLPSRLDDVNKLAQQRDDLLADLRQNLLKSQDQMRAQANKHRRLVNFDVGEWVFLKLQPYKFKSLVDRPYAKLDPKYYGLFQTLSRVGEVAYKLNLPLETKVHPMFHVSWLKKALKPQHSTQTLPAMLTEELEMAVQLEDILQWRTDVGGNMEILVKWVHLPSCDNSWERASKTEVFPSFPLEDKSMELAHHGEEHDLQFYFHHLPIYLLHQQKVQQGSIAQPQCNFWNLVYVSQLYQSLQ